MKKLVFVVLTTSLLLMMVLFSAYAEDGIQPCYTLTSDVSAALSISGGTATCSGKILMRSGSIARHQCRKFFHTPLNRLCDCNRSIITASQHHTI